jgi:hypothetical protein
MVQALRGPEFKSPCHQKKKKEEESGVGEKVRKGCRRVNM